MRRVLIIIAAVIVLLGIGLGLYYAFFAGRGPALIVDEPENPFGGLDPGGVVPGGSDEPESPEPGTAGTEVAPRLVKISDGPVAKGAVAFTVELPDDANGTTTTTIEDTEIRYIERASGNVYSYLTNARTLTRLSNRTIPGVVEAEWLDDGTFAYVRFMAADDAEESIETYALPAYGDGGFFLERGLSAVATRGSESLLSVLTTTSGSTGTVAEKDGTGARTAFSTSLSALRFAFAGTDFVAHTKPSAHQDGYAFFIAGAAGNFTRILGPLPALSALPSPTGAFVLYSYVDRGTTRLTLLDLETRETIPLPLATFAEKCVWAADEFVIYCAAPRALSGTLPDDWYQGAVSFTDRIWRIDLSDRIASLSIDPFAAGDVEIDAVALATDSASDVLVFTNKRDGSLWVYDL